MRKLALVCIIALYGINVVLVWGSVGSESEPLTTSGALFATLLLSLMSAAYWLLFEESKKDRWIPVIATGFHLAGIVSVVTTVGGGTFTYTTGVAIFATIVAAGMIGGAFRLYRNAL